MNAVTPGLVRSKVFGWSKEEDDGQDRRVPPGPRRPERHRRGCQVPRQPRLTMGVGHRAPHSRRLPEGELLVLANPQQKRKSHDDNPVPYQGLPPHLLCPRRLRPPRHPPETQHRHITAFQVWDYDSLVARGSNLDILVISGLWQNDILASAPNLRFIQSIGAGYDQFPLDELRSRGIRLANASGVNKNAVSEHTFSLILSLTRHLKSGARNQLDHFWRGMISEIPKREDELAGQDLWG